MDSKNKIQGPTGFVTEPRMAEHRCLWDDNYPECPERLIRVINRYFLINIFLSTRLGRPLPSNGTQRVKASLISFHASWSPAVSGQSVSNTTISSRHRFLYHFKIAKCHSKVSNTALAKTPKLVFFLFGPSTDCPFFLCYKYLDYYKYSYRRYKNNCNLQVQWIKSNRAV